MWWRGEGRKGGATLGRRFAGGCRRFEGVGREADRKGRMLGGRAWLARRGDVDERGGGDGPF